MRIFDILSVDNQVAAVAETVTEDDQPQINPIDHVTMDVPLLLRIMEYAKEDAKTDMDLHHVADNLIEMSKTGQTLTMAHYNDIVGSMQEADNSAEKLVRDIEYHADDEDEEEVQEGHGRYWCSTDKRWKERKGPKQSRG